MTTFLQRAQSIQNSNPVELYKFQRGQEFWRYSTGTQEVVHDAETYIPYPIQRSRIKQDAEVDRNMVELKFARSHEFARYYINQTPVQTTMLTVFRGFPDIDEWQQWWKGRIIGALVDKNVIKIECEPIYTALKRPGLRKLYEITCSHSVYDIDCRAERSAFQQQATITGISGKIVSLTGVEGADANTFQAGMLVNLDLKRYYISSHTTTDFTIFLYPELVVGEIVSLFPGCSHAYSECVSKFNNGLNFGGFPWMPTKNPFLGSIL